MTATGSEERYISGRYRQQNPGWHAEDSAWKANHVKHILERNEVDPRLVGEVGCGAGGVLEELADKLPDEAHFVGYDIAPEAIRLASQRSAPNRRFVCGDFLTSDETGFDLLLALDVFEHVEDYMGFVRALAGRARHYIFHIPLDMNVLMLLRDRQLSLRDEIGHLHYFSKATALRTLSDSGFEICDWFYTAGMLELYAHRSLKTVLANIPRRLLFPLAPDLTTKLLGGYSILVLARHPG